MIGGRGRNKNMVFGNVVQHSYWIFMCRCQVGNWIKSGAQEEGQVGFINLEIINGEIVFIFLGLYKITLEGSFLQKNSQDQILGIPEARD